MFTKLVQKEGSGLKAKRLEAFFPALQWSLVSDKKFWHVFKTLFLFFSLEESTVNPLFVSLLTVGLSFFQHHYKLLPILLVTTLDGYFGSDPQYKPWKMTAIKKKELVRPGPKNRNYTLWVSASVCISEVLGTASFGLPGKLVFHIDLCSGDLVLTLLNTPKTLFFFHWNDNLCWTSPNIELLKPGTSCLHLILPHWVNAFAEGMKLSWSIGRYQKVKQSTEFQRGWHQNDVKW